MNLNFKIIKLIYYLTEKEKKIIILTRNINVNDILEKFKINKSLFNEIIIISEDERKSNYVKNNSIYIDNSFKDRYDVYVYKNINVYDNNMIESLLDIKY